MISEKYADNNALELVMYEVFPVQLSPWITLVHETKRMLKSAFNGSRIHYSGLTSEICSFQVVSVKLDEWADDQVDILADSGGNAAVNMIYEAFVPENYKKPRQDCSSEERNDFIR